MPTCAQCKWGEITLLSVTDRCKHANNTSGLGPVAMRHNENYCGEAAAWFEPRTEAQVDPLVTSNDL